MNDIDTVAGDAVPVETREGCHTVHSRRFNEHYHSMNGSLQESRHVFIRHGLLAMAGNRPAVSVLEIGFGTGLNALLTFVEARRLDLRVHYTGVEAYPLAPEFAENLNFPAFVGEGQVFEAMHNAPWGEEWTHDGFTLLKRQADALALTSDRTFDLVYYDAFSPRSQPDMWSPAQMKRIFGMCHPGAVFVTYCSRAPVRAALQAAGFDVERLPGAPGKREMTRAVKRGMETEP